LEVMQGMAVPMDGNVLVGLNTSDDAGVYRLSESLALVQTVDFITPIVDDPYIFGRIAACNSLSDVYAMGGRPLTALNIVCFPTGKFTLDVLREVLKGGLSILDEAQTQLLGGHSVNDPEMKYGLSVTGAVHPGLVVRNNTIRDGDSIILTKPLGTGVIATSLKAGLADEAVIKRFIESMTTLNRRASEIMIRHNVHACTDVTGFGLVGHLMEMLGENQMEITLDSKQVPLFEGARTAASNGLIPGGAYKNRDFAGSLCAAEASVPTEVLDLFFDPQTSGGLLMAFGGRDAELFLAEAAEKGIADAARIGGVKKSRLKRINIL
jgi:selenide, water dikinase